MHRGIQHVSIINLEKITAAFCCLNPIRVFVEISKDNYAQYWTLAPPLASKKIKGMSRNPRKFRKATKGGHLIKCIKKFTRLLILDVGKDPLQFIYPLKSTREFVLIWKDFKSKWNLSSSSGKYLRVICKRLLPTIPFYYRNRLVELAML